MVKPKSSSYTSGVYKVLQSKYTLLAIVIALLVINLVQYRSIDSKASNNYKTVAQKKGKDILQYAQRHSPSVRGIFSPWAVVAKIAPNSKYYIAQDLISSKDRFNFRSAAYGISGAKFARYENFTSDNLRQAFSKTKSENLVAVGENVSMNDTCFAIYMKNGRVDSKFKEVSKGFFVKESIQRENIEFFVGYQEIKKSILYNDKSCSSKPYLVFVDKKLLDSGTEFSTHD